MCLCKSLHPTDWLVWNGFRFWSVFEVGLSTCSGRRLSGLVTSIEWWTVCLSDLDLRKGGGCGGWVGGWGESGTGKTEVREVTVVGCVKAGP